MPIDDPTKEPQVVPYADQNPQTVHLTDGLRVRKTNTGYVVERLKSDDTWQPLDVAGQGVWGQIIGTLSDQGDLSTALGLKENVSNKSTDTALGTSDTLYPSQKAVKSYVDDHAGGGSFLSAYTARVDISGDDGTGTIGDLTKPFLTVQAAIDAFQALDPIPDWPVIDIGDNSFTEDLTTGLSTLVFIGRNSSGPNAAEPLNSPFNSLRFLSTIDTSVTLVLKDCNALPISGDGSVYIGSEILTGGLLVIGEEYQILNYQAGDDFTNVGGTNETNANFVATGTTPAIWTNGSTLQLDPQFISVNLHLVNARLFRLKFVPQSFASAPIICFGDAHSRLENIIGCPIGSISLYNFTNGDDDPVNVSFADSCQAIDSLLGDVSSVNDLQLYNSVVGGTNSATTTERGIYPNYSNGAKGPINVAYGRATAQSAANASIATFTVGLFDASFEVSMNMNVSAATGISTSMKCDYTDENNIARSMILPVTGLAGSFLANGLVVATGAFATPTMAIRCKAGTTITLSTATGTFTGVTYSAEGLIKQTQ